MLPRVAASHSQRCETDTGVAFRGICAVSSAPVLDSRNSEAGMHARAVVVAAAVAFAAARQAPIVTEAQTPPDLDGVWTFSTLTPLERPAEFAGKPSLTDREAAEFEKRTIERNDRDRRGQNAELDVNGAYNEAWFE